ncbi:MFS transporter [Propionibacteriaceae bacterium Y1923]|uniref:MFS transporter n=1 Tax=Aestuariimicrobium sp. Y1814 TaxID=3418742 RepID=UPI003C25D8D5
MTTAQAFSASQLHRARLGVGLIFLTNGAAYASLVPRLPEVKADLELTNAMFGLAIAAFPAGAFASGLFAAVLIRRFGSPMVAWVGMALSMIAILAAAAAPSLAVFITAVFLAGCSDSVTDVAQNHHALRVQKHMGRSIINSYHAMWSVGALLGGALGAAAIATGLGRVPHLAIIAVLILVTATRGYRMMLPGPEPVEAEAAEAAHPEDVRTSWLRHPWLVLAALSLLAIAGATIEENAGTWATLYMSTELGVTGGLTAAAYVAAMGSHFLGRVSGDWLVNRLGQATMARLGGLLVVVGMGLAIAFPSPWLTVIGYACAGYGVATVVPSIFEAADAMPGFKPGTALMVTSLLLRIGFLASPPLLGLIADASSIRWALLVVPAAGLFVVALSGVLSSRRATSDVPVPASR